MRSIFYTLGATIFVTILLIYGGFILKPITLGLLIAMIIHPVVQRVERKVKYHSVSFFITIGISLLVISGVVGLISFHLFHLFDDLNSDKFTLENIQRAILKMADAIGLSSKAFQDYLSNGLGKVLSQSSDLVSAIISNSSSMFFTGVFGIVFSYFFSAYYNGLKEAFIKIFEKSQREKINSICDEIPGIIRNYLKGTSAVMLILAVVNTLIYLALGLKFALVWGVLSGLLALIPYIGSAVALFLTMSYSFISSEGVYQPLAIFAIFIIVQQIEGNILTPKIVGEAVEINPLAAIVFMIISGQIWGVYGVFISIMVAGILKVVLDQWKAYDAYVMLISVDVDEKNSLVEDLV